MIERFKKSPVAFTTTTMTLLLGVLIYLQSTGLITGAAAAWIGAAVGVLQIVLGILTRGSVTPVVNPMDNNGNPLVPARGIHT